VKARSKTDHLKNRVLISALYDVFDKLPSGFTFENGEIAKRGKFPIGGGSFADVWKGHWLDKPVAVKVLRMALNKKLPDLEEVCVN
jgi:predicted unusual protein kinase regulating ubiquinone biosynthesis (AarF/ABC1/UbiB family)